MNLSIPAWRDEHYVCLAEILLIVGRFITNMQWQIKFDEVAPCEKADELERFDSNARISTYELLHMVTPTIQIVDGEAVATDQFGVEACLLIRAVDSTSWDIETNLVDVLKVIKGAFPEAVEF